MHIVEYCLDLKFRALLFDAGINIYGLTAALVLAIVVRQPFVSFLNLIQKMQRGKFELNWSQC